MWPRYSVNGTSQHSRQYYEQRWRKAGGLSRQIHYGDLLTAVQINTTLQEEIMRVLTQHFGLSVSEQKECIERFADLYFARMEW